MRDRRQKEWESNGTRGREGGVPCQFIMNIKYYSLVAFTIKTNTAPPPPSKHASISTHKNNL